MATRSENNLVGAAGEYFVCAELCRRGFLALMTPKNNPLFDVVAASSDGAHSVSIQVKTRSVHNIQGWKLGTDITKKDVPTDLFVVLVNLEDGVLPTFYVYEYSVLAGRVSDVYEAYINKPKRDGTPKKEVGFRWFDEGSFTDDDRSRKNNWQSIIDALSCPTDKNRLKRVDFQSPEKLTINELLSAHGSVLDELKHRGVIRSKNNPTGDYAEWLFSTKLGLTLEPQANGGFDATDSQRVRYQIKSRRVTPDNPSTQLGVIRNLDKNDFDFLLAVVFDADWQVLRAAKISHKVVGTLATFRSHQNGHIMHLRPTVFDVPEVEDITKVLRD